MQPEKAALDGDVTFVAIMRLESIADPIGCATVVAVTVILIEHDLAVADLLLLVDFPKDDTAVFRLP